MFPVSVLILLPAAVSVAMAELRLNSLNVIMKPLGTVITNPEQIDVAVMIQPPTNPKGNITFLKLSFCDSKLNLCSGIGINNSDIGALCGVATHFLHHLCVGFDSFLAVQNASHLRRPRQAVLAATAVGFALAKVWDYFTGSSNDLTDIRNNQHDIAERLVRTGAIVQTLSQKLVGVVYLVKDMSQEMAFMEKQTLSLESKINDLVADLNHIKQYATVAAYTSFTLLFHLHETIKKTMYATVYRQEKELAIVAERLWEAAKFAAETGVLTISLIEPKELMQIMRQLQSELVNEGLMNRNWDVCGRSPIECYQLTKVINVIFDQSHAIVHLQVKLMHSDYRGKLYRFITLPFKTSTTSYSQLVLNQHYLIAFDELDSYDLADAADHVENQTYFVQRHVFPQKFAKNDCITAIYFNWTSQSHICKAYIQKLPRPSVAYTIDEATYAVFNSSTSNLEFCSGRVSTAEQKLSDFILTTKCGCSYPSLGLPMRICSEKQHSYTVKGLQAMAVYSSTILSTTEEMAKEELDFTMPEYLSAVRVGSILMKLNLTKDQLDDMLLHLHSDWDTTRYLASPLRLLASNRAFSLAAMVGLSITLVIITIVLFACFRRYSSTRSIIKQIYESMGPRSPAASV